MGCKPVFGDQSGSWLFDKTRSRFNRAFNFFPGCPMLNGQRIRLIGFSFSRQDWFLKKRIRKTSKGSMNKFFRDANFLVANITVRQNKANLFKANLLKVI
jgi:hypothetical protein